MHVSPIFYEMDKFQGLDQCYSYFIKVQKAKELLQMESDLTQDFEQRSGKYPRNVPSEESGSQKPFSRPWGDWNLQGTVHSQEEGEEDVKDVQGQQLVQGY